LEVFCNKFIKRDNKVKSTLKECDPSPSISLSDKSRREGSRGVSSYGGERLKDKIIFLL